MIDPETRQRIPKALMRIGDRPVIWHVMKTFATAGHHDFILALGEGGDAIRRYFFNQHLNDGDVEFQIGSGRVEYLTPAPDCHWTVKCVDTGLHAQTGSRIARCLRYVEGEVFLTSYSDCLCDVSLKKLVAHHQSSGKVLTVTGVQPSSRFGMFVLQPDGSLSYTQDTKLGGNNTYINGGFMVMSPEIFEHLNVFNECNLEQDTFSKLSACSKMGIYPHDGYWQAIDTERDIQLVTQLYLENKRPWLSV